MNQFLVMAVRDAVHAFAPSLPESRDCEQCHAQKIAWLLETEHREGFVVKTFACRAGHLTIVQEKAA